MLVFKIAKPLLSYLGDDITEDEMGGACGTRRKRESRKVFCGET
jgi:hypothetical protein